MFKVEKSVKITNKLRFDNQIKIQRKTLDLLTLHIVQNLGTKRKTYNSKEVFLLFEVQKNAGKSMN